jgi:hypothetical protein
MKTFPSNKRNKEQNLLISPTSAAKRQKLSNKIERDNLDFERVQLKLAKRFKAKGMNTPILAKNPTTKAKGGIMDNIGKIFDCNEPVIIKPRGNRTIEQILY